MSESYFCTMMYPGELADRLTSCGRVVANAESKVVDADGRCAPCNQAGALWIRSYGTFLEYKDQPELTKSMTTKDGWLKTGYVSMLVHLVFRYGLYFQ